MPDPRHLGAVAALVLALALAAAGCGSTDNGTAVNGGTTTSPETDLSMSQAEQEAKKYKPKAHDISCQQRSTGVECTATYKGHKVLFTGTPAGNSIAFTFSGSRP